MPFLHQESSLAVSQYQNKLELKCLLGQTHGVCVDFRFNQIIIDDVTIIFCKCGSSFIIKNINFIFKRPINVALECV